MSSFLVILDVLPFEATINRVKNTREREREMNIYTDSYVQHF